MVPTSKANRGKGSLLFLPPKVQTISERTYLYTKVQNLWDTANKGSPEREVHSNIGLPRNIQTFQINSLTPHPQEFEEQQQRQPRASTRKEITKIRAELNDLETKSTILRINKSRS